MASGWPMSDASSIGMAANVDAENERNRSLARDEE